MWAFLHRPPELDYIQATPEWVEGLEESVAIKLLDQLKEARQQTIAAKRRGARG
jgi:hypothetical protein